MGKYKCDDCGTVFDGIMSSCPNCGCPKSECQLQEELTQGDTQNEQPKEEPQQETSALSDVGAEEFKGGYYYTDVDWFETLSSDPWLLTYVQNIGWVRWLFASWHIGGEGKKDVNHIIANDMFFIFNRFWKWLIYPEIWAIFKILPFELGFLLLAVLMFMGGAYNVFIMLFTIAMPVLIIISIWLMWIGFGKSCHRYGIPLIHCFRHLCVVFFKSIKN